MQITIRFANMFVHIPELCDMHVDIDSYEA